MTAFESYAEGAATFERQVREEFDMTPEQFEEAWLSGTLEPTATASRVANLLVLWQYENGREWTPRTFIWRP